MVRRKVGERKMNLAEVKGRLYELTDSFFQGATVIWSEQINTKPPLPYITLKCSGVSRTSFPVEDGEGRRVYQSKTTWEVNLFTKGQPITVGEGVTGNYANTAVSDLTEFTNFLDSEEIVGVIAGNDMDLLLMPPVRDLTELQNDSRYRYRAMAEFTVSFVQEADGPYGIGGMPLIPNSSGGGRKEMADAETEAIETVEMTEGGYENEQSPIG